MTWLTGARLDLHDPVGDLGYFELEQLQDQPRVGARDHDLRSLGRLAHLDDVSLEPSTGLGTLERNLLRLGQQRLNPAQIEQGVTAVALLDDAGDDVTLAAGVLLVLQLTLGLADALQHHLLGGLGGNAPEVVGGDVELAAHRLAILVQLLGVDADIEGVGIDGDPGVLKGTRHALVGGLQGIGQGPEQGVNGDALVCGERLQRFHHVGVAHVVTPFRRPPGASSGRASRAWRGSAICSAAVFSSTGKDSLSAVATGALGRGP